MKNANAKNKQRDADFEAFEAAQATHAAAVEAVAAQATHAAAVEAVAAPTPTLDSLQHTVNELLAQLAAAQTKTTRSTGLSAQAYIKQLLAIDGTALSVDELCAASGKTAVSIRTALTDLRNAKYARGGTFVTVGIKAVDGITRYTKAQRASDAV